MRNGFFISDRGYFRDFDIIDTDIDGNDNIGQFF